MKTLVRLSVCALIAFAISLAAAGLFLPLYGAFQADPYTCLDDGINACLDVITLSALVYGPLFCLVGTGIGTPLLMALGVAGRNAAR
ncbi:hypothetical protein BBB39_00465 [Bordetella trematum]|uniref:Uncharacterized protein n=1 Tax=Bordetella trematum TaxID=123899 RepID=A0A157RHR6_9BORD|nr:hypothetical protein [Bordetella trematum]AZR92407.1 hypothetical protein BBB39_00465 [Bordetella trematum]NNH21150.1 hypothetical protein [Bordetella trematum]SAI57454.1 Uncharacterised protein [Bordetella trematum]SAI60486.1 Uncharacterised protein [Bordetella trematum]SAI68537.1 Uncharacterised protein [Bordetella trematum]